MPPEANANAIVPRFYIHTMENPLKSKQENRPIFDEMEVCEIRLAANRQTVGVFPAHEIWKQVENGDGTREAVTYAMRFNDQYKKFKSDEQQTLSGTPLSELTFLSASKRLELKALSIHTAEALAGLDGPQLKMLGMGGRELKEQAKAYLDSAAGTADTSRLAAENVAMRVQLDEMRQHLAEFISAGQEAKGGTASPKPARRDGLVAARDTETVKAPSPFQDWDDVDIKNWIVSEGGERPKGNPKHETLVQLADDLNAAIEAKHKASDSEEAA